MEEKQLEQQKRMDQLQLDIHKIGFKYKNKQKPDNKNSKKFYFKINKSKKNLLELTNRGQICETKICSRKTRFGAQ